MKITVVITPFLVATFFVPNIISGYGTAQEWSSPTQITNIPWDLDIFPFICSGGGKIAFESTVDGDREIFVVNSDGTGQLQLTNNNADERLGSISGDGGKIAFQSDVDGDWEIFVVNSDGTGLLKLTSNRSTDTNPSISADGETITFSSNVDGDYEIFVVNSDGTGLLQLTNNNVVDGVPSISDDGGKIAFESHLDGDGEIFVVNSDGTGLLKLTNNDAYDAFPSISGDGETISFESNVDGDWEIFVVNSDGKGPRQLTTNTKTDWENSISSDGTTVAFVSSVTGDWELFVVNSDGTGLLQLTNNNVHLGYPSISGDGETISFVSDVNDDWTIFVVGKQSVQHSLTVNVEGSGYTVPDHGTFMYDDGNVIFVDAFQDEGWLFDHWILDGNDAGTANPFPLTMNTDHSLTAVFVSEPPPPAVQHSLTVNVEGSGSTDLGTGVHRFDTDSMITVTAYPEDGWRLDYWILDDENVGNEETITCFMNKNSVLTAFFVEIEPPFPRSLSLVLAVAAGGSLAIGSGYLIYTKFHPRLPTDTAKDISEQKGENDKNKKKKEKKKLPKKAHLKLMIIDYPKIVAGGMTCKVKLRVKNLGPNSAEDVLVSVCSTPGLNWQNKVEKISSLKVGEESTLDFTFKANQGLNRGQYKLRFTAKGKNTFRRVKTKRVRAIKIGLLVDPDKDHQLMRYKEWLKTKTIPWDELHNADDILKLLRYDLIVASPNFGKHPKRVRVLSSFVDNDRALIRVTNKDAVETKILEKMVSPKRRLLRND